MQTESTKGNTPTPNTLLSALINGRLLQVVSWLDKRQTSNVESKQFLPPLLGEVRDGPRRKCRKVSNHCESDATRAKHAIYLLPINVQATTTTKGSGHNTPLSMCVCVCWVIDQSRKTSKSAASLNVSQNDKSCRWQYALSQASTVKSDARTLALSPNLLLIAWVQQEEGERGRKRERFHPKAPHVAPQSRAKPSRAGIVGAHAIIIKRRPNARVIKETQLEMAKKKRAR